MSEFTEEWVINRIQETNPWILPDEAERIANEFIEIQKKYKLYD